MAVKVNCLNPIAACGMELLPDTYEITDNYADADAVLVRSASMHDLELSDKLLCVARAGAGVNNIPLDKCAEKGVVVFNTPGANANGVKELENGCQYLFERLFCSLFLIRLYILYDNTFSVPLTGLSNFLSFFP